VGLVVAVAMPVVGRFPEPAWAQPADVRVLTLRIVAEERYRARPGWEAELRRTVKTVSDIYERAFQIRVVIQDVVPWTIGPDVPLTTILRRLHREVPIGSADALVGFAAERCEGLSYGATQLFGRVAMVQTACLDTAILSNTTAEAVLSHELGHLFGAFHPGPSGAGTVMRYGPADRFDSQNLRIIRLMRTRDFAAGVQGVDAAQRRAWMAIYAEGHASDEPNPLAGAIANAGEALVVAGKEREGEGLLQEAAALDPKAPRVHTMLGFLYSSQGRLPDAVRELQTAKGLSFRETEARTELGFVLLRAAPARAWGPPRSRPGTRRSPPARGSVGPGSSRFPRMRAARAGRPGARRAARPGPPPRAPPRAPTSRRCASASGPTTSTRVRPPSAGRGASCRSSCRSCGADGSTARRSGGRPARRSSTGAAGTSSPRSWARSAAAHASAGWPTVSRAAASAWPTRCRPRRRSLRRAATRRARRSTWTARIYIMDTVRLAQPFAPIPSYMPQPSLTLSGVFRYRVVSEPDALPPSPTR
jgi:Metallo-peptidase family M12